MRIAPSGRFPAKRANPISTTDPSGLLASPDCPDNIAPRQALLSQPAICSGAQLDLSLLATACRNQALVASLQRFGRRVRAQALSSAKAAR